MPGCALDPQEDGGDEALFWECALSLGIFPTRKGAGGSWPEALEGGQAGHEDAGLG